VEFRVPLPLCLFPEKSTFLGRKEYALLSTLTVGDCTIERNAASSGGRGR